MKRLTIIPERHAFFANEVSTGMKLAMVPIDEPPMIAQKRMHTPSSRQAFPRFIDEATSREFDYLNDRRLKFIGEGAYKDLFAYLPAEAYYVIIDLISYAYFAPVDAVSPANASLVAFFDFLSPLIMSPSQEVDIMR